MTDPLFNAPLAEVDPEIAAVLERELDRQRGFLVRKRHQQGMTGCAA